MKENSVHKIDEIFRSHLGKTEEPFDGRDELWNKIEKRRRKKKSRFPVIWLFALLIGGSMTYMSQHFSSSSASSRQSCSTLTNNSNSSSISTRDKTPTAIEEKSATGSFESIMANKRSTIDSHTEMMSSFKPNKENHSIDAEKIKSLEEYKVDANDYLDKIHPLTSLIADATKSEQRNTTKENLKYKLTKQKSGTQKAFTPAMIDEGINEPLELKDENKEMVVFDDNLRSTTNVALSHELPINDSSAYQKVDAQSKKVVRQNAVSSKSWLLGLYGGYSHPIIRQVTTSTQYDQFHEEAFWGATSGVQLIYRVNSALEIAGGIEYSIHETKSNTLQEESELIKIWEDKAHVDHSLGTNNPYIGDVVFGKQVTSVIGTFGLNHQTIRIPVSATLHHTWNQMKIGLVLGAVMNMYNQKEEIIVLNQNQFNKKVHTQYIDPASISTNIGLHLGWNFQDGEYSIYFEPKYSHSWYPFKGESPYAIKMHNVQFNLGLAWAL